jgi:hypothetical protein
VVHCICISSPVVNYQPVTLSTKRDDFHFSRMKITLLGRKSADVGEYRSHLFNIIYILYTVILFWSNARSLIFATDFDRTNSKIGRKFSKLAEFYPNPIKNQLWVEFRPTWTIFDQNRWRKLNCAHLTVFKRISAKKTGCLV